MPSAQRSRRITIEQRSGAVDGDNQPLDEWQEHAKPWARILAPSGMGQIAGEFVAAGEEVSRVQYSMRIGYRPTVTAAMRVRVGGMIYEIRQVVHDEARREHTDLVVATGANNG